jgi:Nucleotide modification associated domain 2
VSAPEDCANRLPVMDRGDRVKMYSYIVARDFRFAPNPFHGLCTLATCKPKVRAKAAIGDWIVGTGSKALGLEGSMVFAMRVAEIRTYDEYWSDQRFRQKRPYLRGSVKQAYGDNIYYRNTKTGAWIQENSHHSLPDGSPNPGNVSRDTKSENVLIADLFFYWGGHGPLIPARFRSWNGDDVCKKGPSHKCEFPSELVDAFIEWVRSSARPGFIDEPAEFLTSFAWSLALRSGSLAACE